MAKLTGEDRMMVLAFMETLFCLDQIGWDVDDLLRECGRMLGDSDQPKYMQNGTSIKEYKAALVTAKRNGVPIEVFKQRMRHGMTPTQAAETKYNPRKRGWKRTK